MEGLRIVMLGKLRSGKTTVGQLICDILKEQRGITLTPRPLAKPIYEEAISFYERHGLKWRKNRKLMEGIGEALNDDYPNGDKIIELYHKDFNPRENIYVEDCRRLTQANYFADLNDSYKCDSVIGKTLFIRVITDDSIRKARCKPGEWSENHVTDVELEDWPADFKLVNNGNDLEELKQQVIELVKQIQL